MPTTYTPSLTGTEDFVTDGDKLIKFIELFWKDKKADDFRLFDWQKWWIRHILERYPADWHNPAVAGELRFRQSVTSMGRQNGKSVLGAIMGIYGLLMHVKGPDVISVAGKVEQANIIYGRVKYVIDSNKNLSGLLKTSGTRGIKNKNPLTPMSYVVKANNEEALNGFTGSMCLYDEVHITPAEAWDQVVLGSRAVKNAMVVGITTAGSDKSHLLKRLYKVGKQAANQEGDYDERFGFFLWEAPVGCAIDDPAAFMAANPNIASGFIPVAQEINAAKTMPVVSLKRYVFNQFVSNESSWLEPGMWNALKVEQFMPGDRGVTFALNHEDNWRYISIVAAKKDKNGIVHTKLIASYQNKNHEFVFDKCKQLAKRNPDARFAAEATKFKSLVEKLRTEKIKAEFYTAEQMKAVSSTAYSLIANKRVTHAGQQLVNLQINNGVSEQSGDGWKVTRKNAREGTVDVLMAWLVAVHDAENAPEPTFLFYTN